MAPRPQNGLGVFFFVFLFLVFLLGVLRNWVFFARFLDGKSWWICGENVVGAWW
jgi:hypothetical protein